MDKCKFIKVYYLPSVKQKVVIEGVTLLCLCYDERTTLLAREYVHCWKRKRKKETHHKTTYTNTDSQPLLYVNQKLLHTASTAYQVMCC